MNEKFQGLVRTLIENPIKTIAALGLAGLVATTSLKDNVYWGSVTINNPQGNYYAWGLTPIITVKGENVEGNFRTYGLLAAGTSFTEGSSFKGNLESYSLFAGGNEIKENSSFTGDIKSYCSFICQNIFGDKSEVNGNTSVYSLFLGYNIFRKESKITGNTTSVGLINGTNSFGDNSIVNGNLVSKGLISDGGTGFGLGESREIGLKDYVFKPNKEVVNK